MRARNAGGIGAGWIPVWPSPPWIRWLRQFHFFSGGGRFNRVMLAAFATSPEALPASMFYLLAAVFFCIGACLGSYFNVCIYRIPLGQSTNNPRRSYCFSCGSMIRPVHNVPLFSYVALRGCCPDCGSSFSSRYFWIELLTAALMTFCFLRVGMTPLLLPYFAFIGMMIVATFTDIDNWIIPDRITIGGFIAGVALAPLALLDPQHVLTLHPMNSALNAAAVALFIAPNAPQGLITSLESPFALKPVVDSLLGAGFGFCLLLFVRVAGGLLFRKEAMGFGDVKLFACIGAFLGWLNCLYVLMLASFIGSICGLTIMAINFMMPKRKAEWTQAETTETDGPDEVQVECDAEKPAEDAPPTAKSSPTLHPLPFGPYICLAAVLVLLFQREMPGFWLWLSSLFEPLAMRLYGME